MPKTKKLLIVRIDGMGDIILFSPVLEAYRKAFPGWKIDLLVTDFVEELVKNGTFIDKTIPFSRSKFQNFLWYRLLMRWRIRKEHYDKIIYPPYTRHPDGDDLVKNSKASEKIAFASGKNDLDKIYTKIVIPDNATKHEFERNIEFAEKIGISIKKESLKYPFLEEIEKSISKLPFSSNKDFIIGFGIGAGHISKKWPKEKFIELGKKLTEKSDTKIILIGDKADSKIAKEISEKIGKEKVSNFAGKLSILETAKILKSCKIFFGNDSGPKHLAAAVNVPIIEVSSYPTKDKMGYENSEKRFGPWNVNHRIIHPEKAGEKLSDISAEKAYETIDQLRAELNL